MCFSKRENNSSAISLSAPSKAPLSSIQKNKIIYTNKFPNGKMVITFHCSCCFLLILKNSVRQLSQHITMFKPIAHTSEPRKK